MTVSVCSDPLTSQPWHAGPLALHIDWFAGRLAEQGYAHFTAQEKLRLVTHLSQWLQAQHLGAEALDEPCMGQFLLRRAATVNPRPAQAIVSVLRTFCRFLVQRGDMSADLAAAIPAVADWRLATVPKALAPAQVSRLLQSCNQDHSTGQRDYTIVLLMARLGLRPGEVVAMTLDDLDWEAGVLLVRGKGGRRDPLPLPQDVGQALVTYLSDVRPRCATRRVFLRMKAPQCGFDTSVAICTIVRRALERAGLEPPCKGAHILRHSLATNLLHAGAAMADISDILRHRRPQTTELYAKVDRAA